MWRRAFYELDVSAKPINIGINRTNAESKSIEVPKGMMVPDTVDSSNWNHSSENRGSRRGAADRVIQTKYNGQCATTLSVLRRHMIWSS